MPTTRMSNKHTPLARAVVTMLALLMALGLATVVRPAAAHAAPVKVWDRLALCESSGRWHIATGNGYYGGLQFSAATWRAFGGGQYAGLPNRASKGEQIRIAKRVRAAQGWGAWPACSARLGLS